MSSDKSQKTITVEGIIAHSGRDACNEEFELDGVDTQKFMASGFMTRECSAVPSISSTNNIVGYPQMLKRTEDTIAVRAKVFDLSIISLFKSHSISMGCALVGKVLEREGPVIKRCEVTSVALIPADQLTDPRCIAVMVEDDQGRKIQRTKRTPMGDNPSEN